MSLRQHLTVVTAHSYIERRRRRVDEQDIGRRQPPSCKRQPLSGSVRVPQVPDLMISLHHESMILAADTWTDRQRAGRQMLSRVVPSLVLSS
jgi:hypothetical protein